MAGIKIKDIHSFHRAAIMKYGITPYHRKSFALFDSQFEI